MNIISASTFQEAFKEINRLAVDWPDSVSETRIGKANELIGVGVEVQDGSSFVFSDPKISRIKYEYAQKFWEFMISGGTDAEEAFKDYPSVARFVEKPKSDVLPANFNTFYGPRIVKQLRGVIDELVRSPTSRRATILILSENDQIILDTGETLEYPCTISMSFQLRDGVLWMQTSMRSQNLAIVFQLDIYLQGKLLELVAKSLRTSGVEVKATAWQCFMNNAHVFERDFDYVETFA